MWVAWSTSTCSVKLPGDLPTIPESGITLPIWPEGQNKLSWHFSNDLPKWSGNQIRNLELVTSHPHQGHWLQSIVRHHIDEHSLLLLRVTRWFDTLEDPNPEVRMYVCLLCSLIQMMKSASHHLEPGVTPSSLSFESCNSTHVDQTSYRWILIALPQTFAYLPTLSSMSLSTKCLFEDKTTTLPHCRQSHTAIRWQTAESNAVQLLVLLYCKTTTEQSTCPNSVKDIRVKDIRISIGMVISNASGVSFWPQIAVPLDCWTSVSKFALTEYLLDW